MPAAIDEEIVACLSEAVKTMVLENLSVDHFEKVLHRLRRPVSEPVGLRNELGPDFVDDPDMLTFINMSLLKSAGLGYPKDIEECRAIASSLNRLRKSCGCSPIFSVGSPRVASTTITSPIMKLQIRLSTTAG